MSENADARSELVNAIACAVDDSEIALLVEDAIAAAEERGRRRGVEERDELRLSILHALEHLARVGTEPGFPVYEASKILNAALAPRDSAPARYCDAVHPSKPLKCGRFVQHDGPHTAFTPGFDSENRRAVHWERK